LSDATALAAQGWAARAFALGWSERDLFGAVDDPDGGPDGDGLAVWLGGRRLAMLSDTFALVEEGQGKSYFNRKGHDGTRLLWEY
jgi:hypothetical protein